MGHSRTQAIIPPTGTLASGRPNLPLLTALPSLVYMFGMYLYLCNTNIGYIQVDRSERAIVLSRTEASGYVSWPRSANCYSKHLEEITNDKVAP